MYRACRDDGLRPPASPAGFAGRLRRSLTRHPIEKRFGLYRVGGEGVAQRIQLATGLGLWPAVCGRSVPRGRLLQWTRPRESLTSEPSLWLGRVRCGQGHEIPSGPKISHGRGASPPSGAWGTFTAVGKCPHQQGSGQCGVERARQNARRAPGRTASARAETGRRRGRQAWRAGPGEVIPSLADLGAAGEPDGAVG